MEWFKGFVAVLIVLTFTACFIAVLHYTSFERQHSHDYSHEHSCLNNSGGSKEKAPIFETAVAGLNNVPSSNATSLDQWAEPNTKSQNLSNANHYSQVVMAFFAFLGLIIGGYGLYFIWRTVLYTKMASQSTSKALKIAQETLAQTKQTNVTELRAYVSLTFKRVSDINDGQETEFVVKLKNTGSTPAKIIKTHLATRRRPTSWPDIIKFNSPTSRSIAILCPNDTSEIKTRLFIANGTVNGLRNQTQVIQVAAIIIYKDIFNMHRRTIAHWEADRINSNGGITFHPADRGNGAT